MMRVEAPLPINLEKPCLNWLKHLKRSRQKAETPLPFHEDHWLIGFGAKKRSINLILGHRGFSNGTSGKRENRHRLKNRLDQHHSTSLAQKVSLPAFQSQGELLNKGDLVASAKSRIRDRSTQVFERENPTVDSQLAANRVAKSWASPLRIE